jgi:acetyl esterase/lipase
MPDPSSPITSATGLAAIDPSLRTVARFLPYRKGLFARHLGLIRASTALARRLLAHRDCEVVAVSSTATVRIHRPPGVGQMPPAVLWIHGGGYVAGSAALGDRAVRTMAENVDAVVVSVEYRLAPEHPYPAALDDCYAALQWVVSLDEIDSHRIVVAGLSAGGGLAAALALRCVDSGLVDLAGLALISPMLDDRTVHRTTVAGARGWTPEDNAFGWRAYLGSEPGIEGISAYAAPARCANLSGLPPTWLAVGAADLFHDEVVRYADRLRSAGISTRLDVIPGAFHGFQVAGRYTALARQLTTARNAAIRGFIAT